MDAVAQQAGMSKKTIYREFKSQLELLGALLHESLEDMGDFPPPKPGDDVELELYSALVRMVTHVTSPRSMALMRLPTRLPIPGAEMTSTFGNRVDPFAHTHAFHAGLDFAAAAHGPANDVLLLKVSYSF